MPSTWKQYATEIIGYNAPILVENEDYVVVHKVQKWIDSGKTVKDIALLWNQGHTGKCSSGVNKFKVKYDSCEYMNFVVYAYNN